MRKIVLALLALAAACAPTRPTMKMLGATAQHKKLFLRLQLSNPTASRRVFLVACSDKRGKRQQKTVSVSAGASVQFLLPLEGLFGELSCGFKVAGRGAGGKATGSSASDRSPTSASASAPASAPTSRPAGATSGPASRPTGSTSAP